jgi:hypothetical protein
MVRQYARIPFSLTGRLSSVFQAKRFLTNRNLHFFDSTMREMAKSSVGRVQAKSLNRMENIRC